MAQSALFPKTTYVDRRAELSKRLSRGSGRGVGLLLGLSESSINYADNWYPFRQDSCFLYYCGLAEPGLAAVIDFDSGETTLFGEDPSLDDLVWTGPRTPLEEAAERVGIEHVAPPQGLRAVLDDALSSGRTVHTLPPYRAATREQLSSLLPNLAPSLEWVRAIVAQREIKTQEEIAEIERAVEVSARVHEAALKGARPGRFEYEVVAEMLGALAASGMRSSFPMIATIRGETLHNHAHHRLLEDGQLFLSDAGAETALGYAGDLSRTGPVSPTFTPQQKEIYEVALGAHLEAIAAVQPGGRFLDVHRVACRALVVGLSDLGLMQGDPDEAVAAGAHALFFPCGTGHMMGLDVHDMEALGEDLVGYGEGISRSDQFGLKSLRLAKELRPGFVLTVEPGIYFIPGLIDQWQAERRHLKFIRYEALTAYRDFGGIRSEDNLVVTDQGHRLLGPPLARSTAEIEALKASA